MDEEPKHVQRILYCNNCGEDMIHHGIVEKTYGGTAETHIFFDPGNYPGESYSETCIEDVQNQEVLCRNCEKLFCDGEVFADEIIQFYEGTIEYLKSYVESMGGAPVPSVL